jgi:hypothetical protein
VVESERQAPVAGVEDDRRPGVVGAFGSALGPGHEHRRDRMETGVPRRVRVRAQLAEELDVERGLLAGFANGGRLERLAVLDKTAGERPAGWRVPPLDEDDTPSAAPVHDLDDDVDGRDRVAELGTGHRMIGLSPPFYSLFRRKAKRHPRARLRRDLSPFCGPASSVEDSPGRGGAVLQTGGLARKMLL